MKHKPTAPLALGLAMLCAPTAQAWQVPPPVFLNSTFADSGDGFGTSVALSGNTLVIGAPGEDGSSAGVGGDQTDDSLGNAGAVFVYEKLGPFWLQVAYLKASDPGYANSFGSSVAISGDTIAVGAPLEGGISSGIGGPQGPDFFTQSGAVYVFTRTASVWSQEEYIKASNSQWLDRFGSALALDGDTLVVAAPLEDGGQGGVNGNQFDESATDSGAAYVFVRGANGWSQQAYLKASFPGAGYGENMVVDVDGDLAALGFPSEASGATGVDGNAADTSAPLAGATFLFERVGATWTQAAYIKASNAEAGDLFGSAVGLSGQVLAVGAEHEDGGGFGVGTNPADNSALDSGAVYAFGKLTGAWSQDAYIKGHTTAPDRQFGDALALDGNLLLVGAKASSFFGPNEGHAYLYKFEGSAWSGALGFSGSYKSGWYSFTSAVALDGTTALVGAPIDPPPLQPQGGSCQVFDVQQPCGISTYGSGEAKLAAIGSPHAGGSLTFSLSQFDQTGVALLVISSAPAQVPLNPETLLVDLALSILGPGQATLISVPGSAALHTVPIPPGIGGVEVYAQAAMPQSGGGLEFSNALAIEICP